MTTCTARSFTQGQTTLRIPGTTRDRRPLVLKRKHNLRFAEEIEVVFLQDQLSDQERLDYWYTKEDLTTMGMNEVGSGNNISSICARKAQQDALERAAFTAKEVGKYREEFRIESMTKIIDDVLSLLETDDYVFD